MPARYLELLARSLTRIIDDQLVQWDQDAAAHGQMVQCASTIEARSAGLDWPVNAETMIGLNRLRHLATCAAHLVQSGVGGDFVEAGVWRGGASIMLRAVLEACGDSSRRVWVADSFAGLPPPSIESYPDDEGLDLSTIPLLSVSRAHVEANFARYDLLDDRVQFIQGWFKDTLASAPIGQIALLRIDADMYESTMDVLRAVYDRVSIGGYVMIDDYLALLPCQRAVEDFRLARNIQDPIYRIDQTAVYWIKSR